MQDEAFHEIQLNGKQLVFLFMAATVVAVVIFLSGVLVGRGVQTQQTADTTATSTEVAFDPTAPTAPAPADGTPLTAQETLTYADRLSDARPPAETLTSPVGTTSAAAPPPQPIAEPPVVPPPAPAASGGSVAVSAPAPARPATSAPATASVPAAPASSLTEPAGNGFVVQVAAVRQRAEAEVIARRLGSKGYPAFVSTPAGATNVFRVRVGKFDERREAEAIAGRLEREEQFRPWITR